MTRQGFPPDVRTLVLARCAGACERCGMAPAAEIHHRNARGMGGVHGPAAHAANSASNALALCSPCHRYVEAHPSDAYMCGWKIRDSGPLDTPVLLCTRYGTGWFQLSPAGDYLYVHREGERA